jgi:hypothetical protein
MAQSSRTGTVYPFDHICGAVSVKEPLEGTVLD